MQFGQELSKETLPEELKKRFDEITSKDKVVLFMKGNRQMPQCGFSDTVVKVLNFHEAEYQTYDVLSDPEIRSGMKSYSEWATFPQLYINSEFIGGCDIIMEMQENGEMATALKA
ncbi:MAG: Grx4 family monothiol glutaredoxin [Candidatus Melainabacteria bacterium]|jgi:monothiol glutaredoxin|nr:Grx4 family monothiol glutaredoxin [Candidatus Melainabacteria bacterium]